MTYTPYEWADGPEGGTPIVAERLNHIEQGIADAAQAAEDAAGSAGTPGPAGPAGIIRVTHGAVAGTARPHTGYPIVLWQGSVEPTNADLALDLIVYG